MLEQLAKGGLMDVTLEAKGDLHIDFHHTTEDTGYVIGEAVSKALGDRAPGYERYGHAMIPFDETLTRVGIDLSNRPYLVWKVALSRPKLGDMDTELYKEWFQAFAQSAGATLHVENLYGENNHHIVESSFKGLARALRQAVAIDPGGAPARCRPPRGPSAAACDGGLVMSTAIVDYGSGNLRSAAKAFERAAAESGMAARSG